MLEPQDSDVLWIVVVGFIVSFVLAFGIGANDVANSFGTSVGAKVLTLRQACIIATIFELAGAILIGARVSDTVRKGIIDINSFNGTEELAMIGSLSALSGTGIWLIVATFFNLPVSGTHSVVGATMGYALVAHGLSGVKWKTFGLIAASWVVSPLLSGLISSLMFVLIRRFILSKITSFDIGLKSLPLFYAITIAINFFSVFYKGSNVLRFDRIPWWGALILSIGSGIIAAVLVHFVVSPYLKKKILREVYGDERERTLSGTSAVSFSKSPTVPEPQDDKQNTSVKEADEENNQSEEDKVTLSLSCETQVVPAAEPDNPEAAHDQSPVDDSPCESKELIQENGLSEAHKDRARSRGMSLLMESQTTKRVTDEPKTGKLFAFLQILTASFGAFAHGGNDVSNAIGPLISLWVIYWSGMIQEKVRIPVWILVYGGVGICIGLFVWGRRVIKTVGEDLTPITPSSGFVIEIGSALTVLLASNLGIPISTTHCKVGSVVMVGRVRSKDHVDWSLFRNVILAWVVTMPFAGLISAGLYAALREAV
ncbi:sodium-dependent phosphate transporter 1-A-like isoform X2 [Oculina patagonica]